MVLKIAEIGINHNGKLRLAIKLADEAYAAGADVAKYQTFWDMGRLEQYELNISEWIKLKKHCDKIGIIFMSTCHTFNSIDFIDTFVPMHKIASPYITNKDFIDKILDTGKPILMSTGNTKNDDGMATFEEIEETLSWINRKDNLILMHCVSKYPCEDPCYWRINELKEFGYPVGLSDHSKNIIIPKDIEVIEKHFMLEDQECIDKNVSLTPTEFKTMVDLL